MGMRNGDCRLYAGVDVGGTKIQASLVEESGAIVARERCPTPRRGPVRETLDAIGEAIARVLASEGLADDDLTAIGVAVPGVVDPKKGRVVVTPNMNLTGARILAHLETRFGLPVVIGNDCNLGALGEKWLGAARGTGSVFSVLVGTGIGGGFVRKNAVWRGYRNAAAEIGHIVMEIDGPMCGCGNRGCLEAIASRTAIERNIRDAVKAGKKTVLTDLLDGDLKLIRSGRLAQALVQKDPLVTEVLRHTSEVLGYACLTVRHLLDPEVIVLGGGVVEACGDFVFPIVRRIVESDRLPGAREGGQVLLSALGDDAVVLGAVALARRAVGRNPFSKRFAVQPSYSKIRRIAAGEVAIGGKAYKGDICIRVNGMVKRCKRSGKGGGRGLRSVGPRELDRACKGGPEVLFVGTGISSQVRLTRAAEAYLRRRAIECRAGPTSETVESYNACKRRKAALLHVTG